MARFFLIIPAAVVAAGLAAEVIAARAAPLPLGLMQAASVTVQDCDRFGANPRDPQRVAGVAGVEYNKLDVPAAIAACEIAMATFPLELRFQGTLAALYYTKGDYQAAFAIARPAANAGNVLAMDVMGSTYLYQTIPGLDPKDARPWMQKAADAGFSESLYALGYMAEFGIGQSIDVAAARRLYVQAGESGFPVAYRKAGDSYATDPATLADAVGFYRLAADAGDAEAMRSLANHYYDGRGVAQNDAEAARYYELAANAGNAAAMADIGWMFTNGRGVTKDFSAAFGWLTRSAEAGDGIGMANLGWAYYRGEGTPEDKTLARQWFEKAAATRNGSGHYSLAYMQDEGTGGERDPQSAARGMLEALVLRNATAEGELKARFKNWSPEFREALQRQLKAEGFFRGQISTLFDDAAHQGVLDYVKVKQGG